MTETEPTTDRQEHEGGGEAGRAPESPRPFHLLFVCTGNTCRSPLAMALAQRALRERGWTRVEVRSAGVAAYPGGPASQGSIRAAERHGIDLRPHRAVQLTRDLVAWSDLVLTMSPGHLVGVELLGGEGKSELITDFASGGEPGAPEGSEGVSDPIGGGDEQYERTFRELSRLVERALDRLAASSGA
jgi:protein arginine phosphatase